MWLLPFFSGISSFAARTFYRLQIVGPPVPAEGPVLLLANHPNSLLDPALVAAAAGRPVRFLAKSTLFTDSRVGWLVRASGAIPVYRRSDDETAAVHNVDMFTAVRQQLGEGAAVGIFPEGISHSLPSLAQLKTGSARIALGAAVGRGSTFPLIPVGLVLREKGVFRSPALVLRGKPVEWDDLAGIGSEDQEAVRELTQRLDQALREVTVNLEQWEDRPLIDCAEAVWSAEVAEDGDEVEQVKRAQNAAAVLADLRRHGDQSWVELAREIDRHRRRLQRLGLEPGKLDSSVELTTGAGWAVRRLPLVIPPTIGVALLGSVLFWVPFHLTGWLVTCLRPAEEQRSTYKVLSGALLHSLWVLLLATLAWWAWGARAGLAALVLVPVIGFAGLWVRERWQGAWSDARAFMLLRSRRELHRRLGDEQRTLAGRLRQAWEEWRTQQGTAG